MLDMYLMKEGLNMEFFCARSRIENGTGDC